MSASIVVVSGSGRYSDPWHPFPVTSARVADVLAQAGHDVEISDDVDARLSSLSHDDDVDLLVLNIGAGTTPEQRAAVQNADEREIAQLSDTDAATRDGLLAYLERGRPLLALHVTSTTFGYMPEWESILGGIWVRGTSMHPPYSLARIEVATDAHPIVAGVRGFDVHDERYSHLRVSPEVSELAWHEYEGRRHPVIWAHETGGSRVVYDALGHDAAGYDPPEHRAILTRAADWLLRELG